jgi:hypothetical protein
MKPAIAKFLIAIYLFSFTPLKELNRIPLLFIHYAQHLEEDSTMTVAQFFDMHYMHGIVFDEDYEQDMQLPFKTFDFSPLPVFVFQHYKEFDIIKKNSPFIINTPITFKIH